MRGLTRSVAALAAALFLILLNSCGGAGKATINNQSWQPNPGLSAGVPFPVDRATSVLATTTKDGIDDDGRSTNCTEFGTSLELDATATSTEYAIYSFHPGNTPNQFNINIDEPNTTEYWVGVADYIKSRWVFDGPFTTTQSFGLTAADNVSPLGNIPVVVVTPPNMKVRIDTVQLTSNNSAPVPSFTATAGGPAPVQIDVDASASNDPDGSIVLYEWDWENDGTYDDLGSTASHIYAAAGLYTIKLRVTDNGNVTASTTKQVTVTPAINQAPHAVVTASPKQAAPYMTTLDASGSSDPDGTIAKYEWDLDNNGTYEDDGGTTPTKQFNVAATGAYTIGLRVTDNTGGLGGQDTTTITVVGTGWKDINVSSQDDSGFHSSLAEINGKPAVAYQYIDSTSKHYARYAYSSTATGGSLADWQVVTVSNQTTMVYGGGPVSLSQIAGDPAISCAGAAQLMYARSNTPAGDNAADWTAVLPYSPALGQADASCLTTINGNAAIAFDNQSSNVLYYTYSSSADGANAADWSTPVQVDPTGNGGLGRFFSMVEVNGSPAIAYSSSNNHVRYARANDVTGATATSWSGVGSTQFDLGPTGSYEPTLAIVSGHPAVVYGRASGGNSDPYYVYSSTISGSNLADWAAIDLDAGAADIGQLPKLAVCNDKPAVLWLDFPPLLPPYATYLSQATTATGGNAADWPAHGTSVPAVNMENYNSFASISGYAALSYYDGSGRDLHYAILYQ